jgi:nucleoid-associated protein YgaU
MSKTLSIGERMRLRQAAAQEKIRGMLWADEVDGDAIAQVALQGGIEPTVVDKMHTDAQAAKATLQAAMQAHERTPGIERRATAARAKNAAAAKALELARTAAAEAERAQASTEAAVTAASVAITAAAQALQARTIPTDRAPEFLAQLIETWAQDEASQARVSRMFTLKAQIRWLENRIEGLQSELKAERRDDPAKENSVAGPSGLIPLQDALSDRLRTEREQLKAVKAELRKLEKQD